MVKGIDFRYTKLFERIEMSLSVDELTQRNLQEFLGFNAYGGLNRGRKDLLILPFTIKKETEKTNNFDKLVELRKQAEALPIHDKEVTNFIDDKLIEIEERRIAERIAVEVEAQFRQKKTGRLIRVRAVPTTVIVRGKTQNRLRDSRGRFVSNYNL